MGATHLAAMLANEGPARDRLLLDVTPRSLSVALKGNMPSVLIRRNTTIPTSAEETFTTTTDNQDSVTVRVYEGEEARESDNIFVGEVTLTGVPPAPAGVPVVEVTFEVDAAGTLSVSAMDKGTSKTVNAEMAAPYRLNAAQVGVLTRKVEAALTDMRRRIKEERERQLYEEACRSATDTVAKLNRFLDERADLLSPEQKSILASGREVIHDYLDRQTGWDRLQALLDSVRKEYHDAILAAAKRAASSAAESQGFRTWASEASRPIESLVAAEELLGRLQKDAGPEVQALLSLFRDEDNDTAEKLLDRFLRQPELPRDILAMCAIVFTHLSPLAIHVEAVWAKQVAQSGLGFIFVLGQLSQGNPTQARRAAAQQLARAGEGQNRLMLLPYFAAERDPVVRSLLSDYVRATPEGSWLDYYLKASEDERASLVGLEPAVDALRRGALRAISTSDTDTRVKAAAVLCETGIEGHATEVAQLLGFEKDERVRASLVRLLTRFGDRELVLSLFADLTASEPTARQAIVNALRHLRPKMTDELVTLLDAAEQCYLRNERLKFGQRRRLRRIGREHPELRDIAETLRKAPGR